MTYLRVIFEDLSNAEKTYFNIERNSFCV